MKTTKAISTISFNTPQYLAFKLEELRKNRILSFWSFISHQPEDDEGLNKHHCHVYMEPAKLIQTDDIRDALKEFDPEHPDKPKGCIRVQLSRFDTWYLYVKHDPAYLASKGESRKYKYSHDDFITSDSDELDSKAKSINLLDLSPYADMEDAIKHGVTLEEYLLRGTIPIQRVIPFREAWKLIQSAVTNRNGRAGHSDDMEMREP